MTILNRIASNWSFQEREKLNNNWTIIESYLSNLQGQVNILTGGVNVQDIVDQINDLLNQGNIIIEDLNAALQDATTVITNAQNATTEANNAAQNALNAINDMQAFINQFGNAETYNNSKLYQVNNLVEFDGSGYICIKDTQGNPPPALSTKRNEWWQLFAQKGVDGTGAVSKVAGKSPELDGNVPLTAQDIGAVNSNDFNKHLVESGQFELYHRSGLNLPVPNTSGESLPFTYREIAGTGADFAELDVNGNVKFKRAGTYMMNVRVAFAHNGSGHRYFGVVYNGSVIFEEARDAASTVQTYLSLTKVIKVKANDTIGIAVFQDSGATIDVDGNLAKTFLELNFLGDAYPT